MAHASHVGEALEADRQLLEASNDLLAAIADWENLPPSLRASGTARLVQLAQTRQQRLLALLEVDARVAGARMLPKPVRVRLPDAVAAYVEREVRAQGNGFASVADNFAKGTTRISLKVVGAGAFTPQNVYLADTTRTERDFYKLTGKKLTFEAMQVGQALVILDKKKVKAEIPQAAGGATSVGASTQAVGEIVQGERRTLSILLNFADKPLSCSRPDIENRLFAVSGPSVNTTFRDSSRGLVGFSGTVVGPYTINYPSSGSCDYLAWAAAADAAAAQAGVDASQYAHVNYVTPLNASCGWSGLGYMPGRQTWVQFCDQTGMYAHELGHNLALHHAATPTSEYGDLSDPMGSSQPTGLNAANRVMAGWQPAGTVVDVAGSGSYSIASVSDSTIVSTPQVLRLPKADSSESYYVSLRTAVGADSLLSYMYVGGVSVHRASGTLPAKTYLVQVLGAGQSFQDPVNGLTITYQGLVNGTAAVGVTLGASTCARLAPSVQLTPASQSSAPGGSAAYAMTVTNRNSAACGTTTFNLSQALPTGFGGTWSQATLALPAGASGVAQWTVTAPTTANGTYNLTAAATDAALPTATASIHASFTAYNEAAPPTVSITSPGGGASLTGNKPVTITVAADGSAGIQAVDIYVDGALLARDVSAPYSAAWNLRKVSKGQHTITARATDKRGNRAEQSVGVTLY